MHQDPLQPSCLRTYWQKQKQRNQKRHRRVRNPPVLCDWRCVTQLVAGRVERRHVDRRLRQCSEWHKRDAKGDQRALSGVIYDPPPLWPRNFLRPCPRSPGEAARHLSLNTSLLQCLLFQQNNNCHLTRFLQHHGVIFHKSCLSLWLSFSTQSLVMHCNFTSLLSFTAIVLQDLESCHALQFYFTLVLHYDCPSGLSFVLHVCCPSPIFLNLLAAIAIILHGGR